MFPNENPGYIVDGCGTDLKTIDKDLDEVNRPLPPSAEMKVVEIWLNVSVIRNELRSHAHTVSIAISS